MTTPKGGKTQTTTQKQVNEYPQWQQDALKGLVGTGTDINSPFLQAPSYGAAGFTPDQMKAFDLVRGMAQGTFTNPQASVGADAAKATAAKVGPAAQSTTAMAQAAQIDPTKISQNMNPYLQGVLAPALKQAARARDETQSAIGARAAASGSFGGSREAIQRGQADRAYQEGTSSMVADLMAKGWDQASALSQANASMQQQANLTNAGAQNNTNLSNTAARNAAMIAQAGFDQQAGMYNAGLPLELARLNDGLAGTNFSRQQSALQALLGVGGTQQQFAQNVLDLPYTALQRLAALTPQQLNSTTNSTGTQPNTAASPLQSLLGAGVSLGSAWLGASDEKLKTNIQPMGRDPDTGLMVSAYDYKADVDAARKEGKPMPPKRVGPMANDAKKAGMPTKRIGGNLAMLFGE